MSINFTRRTLLQGVAVAPALFAGLWLSCFAAPLVNRGWMRPAMLVLYVLAAAISPFSTKKEMPCPE